MRSHEEFGSFCFAGWLNSCFISVGYETKLIKLSLSPNLLVHDNGDVWGGVAYFGYVLDMY
jgi:hypothetical protein